MLTAVDLYERVVVAHKFQHGVMILKISRQCLSEQVCQGLKSKVQSVAGDPNGWINIVCNTVISLFRLISCLT